MGALVLLATYKFFLRQERKFVSEKLKSDVQSVHRVGFFLMARDIRRAGSDPTQATLQSISGKGQRLWLENTTPNNIRILADLDGDGDTNGIDENANPPEMAYPDEDITYSYSDTDGDGIKDSILKQDLNQEGVFLDNVEEFRFSYNLAGSSDYIDDPSANPSLIRRVKIKMKVNAGRNDPTTSKEIAAEYETVVKLRNYQQ